MTEKQNITVCSPIDYDIKIVKWKVKEGFQVSLGQLTLLYQISGGDDTEVKRLKATKCGIVKKRLVKEGDTVSKGSDVLQLAECSHVTVIKDMCADCGADLRQDEKGNTSEASVPMIHSVPDLKVTQQRAMELGQADTDRLLKDRKLVLLVDLDQTLIHTTNDNVPNNLRNVYHFQLYGANSPWYHTRLRPGTLAFLEKMSPYYELHICTFGARDYAHTIATFLDEDRKYFSHRILSRDECFNALYKTDNLKALFPCGDSMVCIIDDREDVWNNASNLIQVKPYHFFQHTGDINAPPGMSKNELDGKGMDFNDLEKESNQKKKQKEEVENDDEDVDPVGEKDKVDDSKSDNDNLIDIDDPDDYLMYLEDILIRIHTDFYKSFENSNEMPDLKRLIPKIRSNILVGANIVFSGLVPNHLKLEQSKAYQIARSLGANVAQQLQSNTTHLVALTAGTFKVNAARKRNKLFIVTPDWLWSCAERWEHVDERLFPLDPNKPSKMRQPPPHCHSPEHAPNYNIVTKSDRVSSSGTSNGKPNEPEPKFVDTINPLLKFSNADIAKMNEEFEEFFESSSSSDDDEPIDIESPPINKTLKRKRKREEEEENVNNINFFTRPEKVNKIKLSATDDDQTNEENENYSSSDDEMPSTKFRQGGDLPSDLDLGSGSEGSDPPIDEDDDGDWNMMGAALEREFLGLE